MEVISTQVHRTLLLRSVASTPNKHYVAHPVDNERHIGLWKVVSIGERVETDFWYVPSFALNFSSFQGASIGTFSITHA
jgi:hypothetical protein